MFPPEIRYAYVRTLYGDDLTNNNAEFAHRKLQAAFRMKHPTLWKFTIIFFLNDEFIRGHEQPVKSNNKNTLTRKHESRESWRVTDQETLTNIYVNYLIMF
ncbi:hypothetical protein ACJMK2_019837 [Sinanodonta woodiana]|uniref:Uncharacterized protein n=1 Tax=Sinanodonta woodiana TaxID=1069815 RepID=A0ABD3TZX9_SINWO